MRTEETKDKGDKAKSTDFGFAAMGPGMFEMMSKCCMGPGGGTDCSAMMKGMRETMKNGPCGKGKKEDTESDRRKT
jgi:hypothetical protein